jgi:TonB family protein
MLMRISASFFLVLMLGVCLSTGQEAQRKVLLRVPPEYPPILKDKNIIGIVRVRVVISPSGAVRSAQLVGGNPILGEAAEKAIRKWRYEASPEETVTFVELRFNSHSSF